MRFGIVVAILGALVAAMPAHAIAADWSRYDNARFAYAIDVPPDFSPIEEAANGDGGVARSADGRAELSVWGNYLVDRDFRSEVADRIQSDLEDGWVISYDRRTARSASWSGSKDGRIVYARAMKGCDDSAIHFRLVYDRSELRAYDAAIKRLVKSLRGSC